MNRLFILLVAGLIIAAWIPSLFLKKSPDVEPKSYWEIQSIDSMKFSRDVAREKGMSTDFKLEIDEQVRLISETGATHISIGTPYDREFIPFMKLWIDAARKYHLNVWFRGNMSGWEGWFEYSRINRTAHTKEITAFIVNNPELFHDGDLFSSCPECENGGPGDPRMTGDVAGHRQFLIDEYLATQQAFKKINKNVQSNVNSMNFDVAQLVMDKQTVQKLGDLIVVDHYVSTPHQTVTDLRTLAQRTGAEIILGEVGAPIPDIHGDMSEKEQDEWLSALLRELIQHKDIIGINYWTGFGASTEVWNSDTSAREAVKTLTSFYKARL